MNKNIKDLIDQYCDEFLLQDIVKQYFTLEQTINESKEISTKQQELRSAQKALALSLNNDDYLESLKKYNEKKKIFEEDPLVVNYNLIKEEIIQRLKQLKDKLNS